MEVGSHDQELSGQTVRQQHSLYLFSPSQLLLHTNHLLKKNPIPSTGTYPLTSTLLIPSRSLAKKP